eukprot:TRINITY_DN57871_c0_g1_i1.p1 TRINITY_DN57871_c0_g1~~TRINITY_DN57871_c0_g1_i1.p1  ORF type:complete len:263 (-),score=65.10 TRINITY_DN57871_c0_g1_i1:29-817(-)
MSNLMRISWMALALLWMALGQESQEAIVTADRLRGLHGVMDGDRNGNVTLDEVIQYGRIVGQAIEDKDAGDLFASIDTSKDGKVTLMELVAATKKHLANETAVKLNAEEEMATARFSAADLNRDGMLDTQEVRGLHFPSIRNGVPSFSLQEAFDDLDKDSDGLLSANEFWGADGADKPLTDDESAVFLKVDTDTDGFASIEEYFIWEAGHLHQDEALKELFHTADMDESLHLTVDEMLDAQEALGDNDALHHLLEFSNHNEL